MFDFCNLINHGSIDFLLAFGVLPIIKKYHNQILPCYHKSHVHLLNQSLLRIRTAASSHNKNVSKRLDEIYADWFQYIEEFVILFHNLYSLEGDI